MDTSPSILITNKEHTQYLPLNENVHLSFRFKDEPYWEFKGSQFQKVSFFIHCDYIMGNILGDTLRDMSVIGFYVTIVLAIGQLIKGIFANITMKVIYEEMPSCDQLIELCDSIYMSRKENDLMREKTLYDLLIRIYRSPELLIQLTGNYLD
jgi:hypothetical protein